MRAVHTQTQEQFNRASKIFKDKWLPGLAPDRWEGNREETCFNLEGWSYWEKDWYHSEWYSVISFEDFLEEEWLTGEAPIAEAEVKIIEETAFWAEDIPGEMTVTEAVDLRILTEEDLREKHKELFWKTPRSDMKKEKLITKLEAALKATPASVEQVVAPVSDDKVYGNATDIKVIEAAVKANMPTLLRWETGTWKTTTVKFLAKEKWKTLVRINLNWQTGREELLWKYVLEDWATKWQDWPLMLALKKGYWVLLDEINAALPEVLFTIQALTETRNWQLWDLLLAEKDWEVITPHKDCRIFATSNPWDYLGTKDFNMATLSRFIVIDVLPLWYSDEQTLLRERFPKVKEEDIEILQRAAEEIRKLKRNEEISLYVSTRDLVQACDLIKEWLTVNNSFTVAVTNKSQSHAETSIIVRAVWSVLSISKSQVKDELEWIRGMREENRKLKEQVEWLEGAREKLRNLQSTLWGIRDLNF